jgi:hypothetical protein
MREPLVLTPEDEEALQQLLDFQGGTSTLDDVDKKETR